MVNKGSRNFRWVLSETSRPFCNRKGMFVETFDNVNFYHKHKHVQEKTTFIEGNVMFLTFLFCKVFGGKNVSGESLAV